MPPVRLMLHPSKCSWPCCVQLNVSKLNPNVFGTVESYLAPPPSVGVNRSTVRPVVSVEYWSGNATLPQCTDGAGDSANTFVLVSIKTRKRPKARSHADNGGVAGALHDRERVILPRYFLAWHITTARSRQCDRRTTASDTSLHCLFESATMNDKIRFPILHR